MKYREYTLLQKLYKMDKEMTDEQKYKMHFVSEVSKQTGLPDSEVLAMAKVLSQKDYIELLNNKPECGGYIHCMGITYIGVSASTIITPKLLKLLFGVFWFRQLFP